MSIRRLTITGLATLTAVGGGLTLASTSALAAGHVFHEFSKAFGTAGSGEGEFNDPVKVAVDETSGDVYVADQGNGRVQKFDAEGNYLSQFNGSETPNPNPGEFTPRYLAVDNACARHEPVLTGAECEAYDPSAGDVYVLDSTNNAIDKFSSTGTYISRLPALGELVLGAVGVDQTGNVIAIASEGGPYYGDGHIYELDDAVNNNFISEAAVEGINLGEGVAVASDETVYILCYVSCVTASSTDGGPSVGGLPVGNGNFGGVNDIAMDLSTSNLYTDDGTEVKEYDQFLNQVEVLGLGRLVGSTGLAVNSATHTVYAADPGNSNVEIFVAVTLPDVSLEPPTNIMARSVTVNGTVVSKGAAETNTIQFEYTTRSGHGVTVVTVPSTCSSSGASCSVSANLTELSPNTTYHYRLAASNIHGQENTEGTFTTSAEVPSIDGESALLATQTSALLAGRINPEHDETTYHIEYGPDTKYGTSLPVPDAVVGSGYEDINVQQDATGLQPDMTYHFRLVATNSAGPPAYGQDETFTTAAATSPLVGLASASAIAPDSVILSGTIDPQGIQASYEFDLGTDTNYGTRIFGEVGSAEDSQTVIASLQDLAPGTTYHYRLLAGNVYGTTYGQDQTFTTPASPAASLTAPLTAQLIPIPVVTFPTGSVATTSSPKSKKPAKKKKDAKKVRRARKARRIVRRDSAHGRSK
jgi:DNA-binding beta-propeller fold protein YncE